FLRSIRQFGLPSKLTGSFAEAGKDERLANFPSQWINRGGTGERAEVKAIIIFIAAAISDFADSDDVSAVFRHNETKKGSCNASQVSSASATSKPLESSTERRESKSARPSLMPSTSAENR